MSLKSINDGIVALTESAGNMNAFVNTVLGYSSFFKALPKYLAELPARFQEVVPTFITHELPSICEKHIDPLFSPMKYFLSYVDFCTTLKTVTDKDFADKPVAKKGNAISKLISSGIETVVIIPAKLQWYDLAGWVSSKMGEFSPYLQTAFSLNTFSLVGNIASIAASIFSIKSNADERQAAMEKIDLAKKNITLLSGALKEKVTTKNIHKICRDYCLGQDKTQVLAKAYQELYKKDEAIKEIEKSLTASRKARKKSSIDKLTKEKEKIYADLEKTKEEIRRLNYFWYEFTAKNILIPAGKEFKDFIFKTKIEQMLKDQKQLAAKAEKKPEGEGAKEAPKEPLLADAARDRLKKIMKSADVADEFNNMMANENIYGNNPLLKKLQDAIKDSVEVYDRKLQKIAPPLTDKTLKTRVVKHVINYEIDRSEIDIRTQKSEVTRSWVITAFEAAKIALTALVATKPIMAILGMAGISLGVAISAPVLAGLSAACLE